ncbi:MAG: winged helix-turn-helix domain-containing protein [Clostridia bacterium]|nr:winged helix-turn-helix domain-containing protein [Clostridia bacterium]
MPVFEAGYDDFTLILYNLNYSTDYIAETNDTQSKIIAMIKRNSRISTTDMAKELGINVNE